jgi:hypothetical protein
MTREKLLHLIKQSRTMLEHATLDQKLHLLKLIKEGYVQLKKPAIVESNKSSKINNDYLDEK